MPWPCRRGLSLTAAWTVLLCGLLCAGCGAAASGAAASGAAGGPGSACTIKPAAMLTQAEMPGFVPLFRFANAPLPGSYGMPGHPQWDVTQYVCGKSYGFVSDVIMYGQYRAQDDALAKSLGYRLGTFPLLPYQGSAVSRLPHGVFEAYEEVFQFRSAQAAQTWLGNARWTPKPPHDLAGLPLPSGFIARAGLAGPDNGRNEHGIGISGQRGDLVIVVSFNGGRELAWSDVKAVWTRAFTYLAETLT